MNSLNYDNEIFGSIAYKTFSKFRYFFSNRLQFLDTSTFDLCKIFDQKFKAEIK